MMNMVTVSLHAWASRRGVHSCKQFHRNEIFKNNKPVICHSGEFLKDQVKMLKYKWLIFEVCLQWVSMVSWDSNCWISKEFKTQMIIFDKPRNKSFVFCRVCKRLFKQSGKLEMRKKFQMPYMLNIQKRVIVVHWICYYHHRLLLTDDLLCMVWDDRSYSGIRFLLVVVWDVW